MRFNFAAATLFVATIGSVTAAPTVFEETSNSLSKRETELFDVAIAGLNDYTVKRDSYSADELNKREVQIVTDVLTAINSTELAPEIILYIVNDPTLGPIAADAIVKVTESGLISLDTLMKSLNDSGLAVQVIQDLINDCQFYAEIYKLALQYIGNLAQQILGIQKRGYTIATPITKRKTEEIAKRDVTGDVLTSLMESLKSSGLGSQVVEALVTDDGFYTWGADLIEKLYDAGQIDLVNIIDALASSGLVPSLIENFLNISTFETVIVNALAAAFGNCNGETLTTVSATTTMEPTASTLPTTLATTTGGSGSTTTAPVNCKKRRRSYNY